MLQQELSSLQQKLTFEQILNTMPDDRMIELINNSKSLGNEKLISENEKQISAETQKLYLAFYARAASEHVGFSAFSKEKQEAFKKEIENLYANIKESVTQGDFLNKMVGRTAEYIEDRHFTVGLGNNTIYGGEKRGDRTVGKNFIYRTPEERPDGYVQQGQASGTDPNGEKFPIWEIGTMKKNNEDILVVSIYDIAHRGNTYEEWEDFITKFDEVYLGNKDKYDNGRIILDVRGNRGGEDKPIDHMAKRLYGNLINTYKRCEMKDTKLSDYLLHKHGAYKEENYSKDGFTKESLVKRKHFSGQNKTLFDETGVFYPFNESKGFKGKLDILLCSRVGSSAESAYTSFYHHPNTRYIGENTAGMQQYTQGTFATPWGGSMRVGVTKLTYWDKEGENIEVKGHKPDIDCTGEDAFDVALSIDEATGRATQKRKTNEPVTGKEKFVEYNPKARNDPRKAYYAKYLEPAIENIEKMNLKAERLKVKSEHENSSSLKNKIQRLRGLSSTKKTSYKPKTSSKEQQPKLRYVLNSKLER